MMLYGRVLCSLMALLSLERWLEREKAYGLLTALRNYYFRSLFLAQPSPFYTRPARLKNGCSGDFQMVCLCLAYYLVHVHAYT